MKSREYCDYIKDILDSMNDTEEFTTGMDYGNFENDRKTIFAVIRSIEIIGEATKNIPKSVRNRYTKIPWKDMAGMRDKVIHEYFGIDLEVIWKTIKEEIPPLKPLIQNIFEDLSK